MSVTFQQARRAGTLVAVSFTTQALCEEIATVTMYPL